VTSNFLLTRAFTEHRSDLYRQRRHDRIFRLARKCGPH